MNNKKLTNKESEKIQNKASELAKLLADIENKYPNIDLDIHLQCQENYTTKIKSGVAAINIRYRGL